MASIRNRGGKWQARVQRKGYEDVVKSFLKRSDAERWARSVELEMDRGSYVSRSEAERCTFQEILLRYIAEVCPTKRSGLDESIRLRKTAQHRIANLSMAALTPKVIAEFRDERLTQVAPNTVIREMAYLSAIINHARREWGINVPNPLELVRKPPMPEGRNRILSDEEEARLLIEMTPVGRRSVWVKPAVILSLETGMRRGELLSLKWSNVDLQKRIAYLPITKNGTSRVVPLSSQAVGVLVQLPRDISGLVIPMKAAALHACFKRACTRSDLSDFHWHDLRHTAISHLSKKLPNLIELAAVSGHRSLAMLKKYYHPSATELALKLG